MSTFFNPMRKPVEVVLPLNEVKRRVIVDALDKCDGNYALAARLLGIGKTTIYRMAKVYNYQAPTAQGKKLMKPWRENVLESRLGS
jgi:transcriptional regulator of acetoin/glycerol metabolism